MASIIRVTTTPTGQQVPVDSFDVAWSPDSTKVVFTSFANAFVPNDTNQAPDVFVKDLTTGATMRASETVTGGDGFYGASYGIFRTNTLVTFETGDNLTSNPVFNGHPGINQKDLVTGVDTIISTTTENAVLDNS